MPPKKKPTAAVIEAPKVETPAHLITYKLYFTAGDSHVCGRASEPIFFFPKNEDGRPHAYVTEAFGDWLIENDRPVNARGQLTGPARYEWSDEALAAFAERDALEA